jgi:hypothetical protein
MKLEIYRKDFGVTPDGEWFQKIDGDWVGIIQPEWSKKSAKKKEKVVDLRMQPPTRNGVRLSSKIKMVKVYRVIEKNVPDYEAEVLCRNGWQNYYPGTLRNHDSAALS